MARRSALIQFGAFSRMPAADVPADRVRRRALQGTAALVVPALLVFLVVYAAPLGSLVVDSFHKDGSFTLANHLESITSPAFGTIVLRTLTLSAIVTVLCLLIGYPLAYILASLRGAVAAGLLLLVSVPYVTSILIRSYAWVVVLSGNGIINKALLWLGVTDEPLRLVFNEAGTYIGMVQVQLPLMVFPLYAAMHRIDGSLVAAARNLGSSPFSAFWHVYLPLSGSGIAGGCTLVFLSCLGFYVTPALLGGPGQYLVAQGIAVRVTTLADFSSAAAQATLLLAVVLVIFIACRRRIASELGGGAAPEAHSHDGAGSGLRRWPNAVERIALACAPVLRACGDTISYGGRLVLWIFAVAALVYLVLPLLVVIPLAFSDAAYLTFPPPAYSLRWFKAFLSNTQWLEATWFSVRMAGVGAVTSLLLGVPVAFALVRRRLVGKLSIYLLLISPLVVPHVVIAVALYFTLARLQLVGTELGFVIAYTLLGMPYVLVVFIAGLRRFDQTLEMAAASLGARPITVLGTVTFPLLVPSLISALLFAFIAGFDDVVLGLFLSGPTATPLPIRMWDNIRLEISPQIAVVAVLLFVALAASYCAYLLLSSRMFLRLIFRSQSVDG
ncbi:MAG TPA: ABC transporter permease subunit [Alphaproteobacteria bacterium]|nr:ABC transporter permease subunit [Alphaproteobacteria bacterium]